MAQLCIQELELIITTSSKKSLGCVKSMQYLKREVGIMLV